MPSRMFTEKLDVPTISVAGQGFVLLPTTVPHTLTVSAITSGVNQTRAYQFVLAIGITFTEIITEITTGGAAGKFYGVGIYDKDKNLIVETGALDAEAVAINSTTVAATTLRRGETYWLAQTTDDSATVARSFGSTFVDVWDLANKNTARAGTGNAGSAGVLPAMLGTITPSVARFPMATLLEP